MLISSLICWRHSFICNISLEMSKNKKKFNENSYYWRRKSSYLLNELSNFNYIFRKDEAYDNINIILVSLSLSLGYSFLEKPQGGVNLTLPPSLPNGVFRVNSFIRRTISLKTFIHSRTRKEEKFHILNIFKVHFSRNSLTNEKCFSTRLYFRIFKPLSVALRLQAASKLLKILH